MFTEINYPEEIFPEELDHYLAKGWFRMGQMIFTCRFLSFKNSLYTALWIRTQLNGFKFSKSQRKLIAHNRRKFTVISRKAIFDKEKETLYKIHKKRFEGYVSKSLKASLFGESTLNIYDTYEIAIYDGDRLAAVSFFDRGEETLASIMGMYDPAYSKFSLGYYTMLEEMDYGIKHDYQTYYPGYVVPGYEKFDYKLRVGGVEYFDEDSQTWPSYDDIDFDQLLSSQLYSQLKKISKLLSEKGIEHKQWLYPLFDKEIYGYDSSQFLRSPLFISCFASKMEDVSIIIEYNLYQDAFQIIKVKLIEDPISLLVPSLFKGFDSDKSFLDFLLKKSIVFRNESSEEVVGMIEEMMMENQHDSP